MKAGFWVYALKMEDNFLLNKKVIREIEEARKKIKDGEFLTEKEARKILRFSLLF